MKKPCCHLENLQQANRLQKRLFIAKGVVLLELGRLEEALEIFSELLSLYPDFEKAWYGRGLVLFSLEKYAEALEAFEQAVLDNQM